jgi:archaetidylinositol phosphate synthase
MKPVQRIQQNILAASERRLLNWLCARLPAWVKPDQLTAVGFSGAVMTSAGYVLSIFRVEWLFLAIAGYFVNWFGDSLDGSLARFREIERPKYGYFIDHSTDSFANMILVLGLGISPYVRLDVALFGLVGYLLMSVHTFLAARVIDEFRLSYMAGGPTELRLVLIAMTIAMIGFGPKQFLSTPFSVFDVFIAGVGIILITLYIVQTIATGRKLFFLNR